MENPVNRDGAGGPPYDRKSEKKVIIQTKPCLSDKDIDTIFDEWDALISCVNEKIAFCVSLIKMNSKANRGLT